MELNHITVNLEAIKKALADYLSTTENDHLKELEITGINKRSFSTIYFMKIITPKTARRLVMKTINHHPVNKAITDRENQAVVEYNVLENLYSKFQTIEKCSVPRPILVVPEIEAYVMEYVEGDLLADEFRYARHFSPKNKYELLKEHYYHCGRWLKHFQEFTGMHEEGPESLLGIIDRCNYRLKLIEELNDPRCPKDLRQRVNNMLHEQVKRSKGEKILVSGRHGDFGSWNILVGPRGVTVIDYLGYGNDPVYVDILKMLVNFEDEMKYLAYNPLRIKELKESFLRGYGSLPPVYEPALFICETFHRVCSLLGSLSNNGGRLHRRIERKIRLKANLKWLTDERARKLIWPAQ